MIPHRLGTDLVRSILEPDPRLEIFDGFLNLEVPRESC